MDIDISKYKNLINLEWWEKVDNTNISAWLDNFKENEWIGKFILDNIIFFNDAQLDSYTRFILNQMKAELYQKKYRENREKYQDDGYYFNCWEEYKGQIKIIPAAKDDDGGGSPYLVARRYRSFLGNECIADKNRIEYWIQNGIKEFIFVDDFAGSGNQMKEFLETKISFGNDKIRICDLHTRFPELKFTIALYVIHSKAKQLFNEKFSWIDIRYVDLIDDNLNFLNKNSIMYKNKTIEEKNKIIECIEQKKQELYCMPQYEKMKKYQLNIPIVFEYGCPNNALLLLFAKTNHWKPIFKLGEDNGTI